MYRYLAMKVPGEHFRLPAISAKIVQAISSVSGFHFSLIFMYFSEQSSHQSRQASCSPAGIARSPD